MSAPITITVPPVFWADHVGRDCVQYDYLELPAKGRRVVLRLDPTDVVDLLSDADHYANESEYGLGMQSSARATARAIRKQVPADLLAASRAAPRRIELMSQLGFDFAPAVCSVDSCDAPRTHAACGEIGPLNFDGTPNVRQGSARVECCLWHANYFANAWCPYYPFEMGSAWLETLSTPSLQSNVPG